MGLSHKGFAAPGWFPRSHGFCGLFIWDLEMVGTTLLLPREDWRDGPSRQLGQAVRCPIEGTASFFGPRTWTIPRRPARSSVPRRPLPLGARLTKPDRASRLPQIGRSSNRTANEHAFRHKTQRPSFGRDRSHRPWPFFRLNREGPSQARRLTTCFASSTNQRPVPPSPPDQPPSGTPNLSRTGYEVIHPRLASRSRGGARARKYLRTFPSGGQRV